MVLFFFFSKMSAVANLVLKNVFLKINLRMAAGSLLLQAFSSCSISSCLVGVQGSLWWLSAEDRALEHSLSGPTAHESSWTRD